MMTKHSFTLLALAAVAGCGSSKATSGSATLESLDTTDAEVGKQGLLRINFDNPVPADTDVMLASTNPSAATVPAKATVPKGQSSTVVMFNAVAAGSVAFTATAGSVSTQTAASVVDHIRVDELEEQNDNQTFEKGDVATYTLRLTARTPAPITVNLASSASGVATVPATLTIPPWTNQFAVAVDAVGVGSTSLTATLGDSSTSHIVNVVAQAHVTSLSAPPAIEAGAVVLLGIGTDAALAKTTTITATSSDKSIATVDSAVIAADNEFVNANLHGVAAGTATVSATLNGSTVTRQVIVVSKAQLSGLVVEQDNILVGATIDLDVQFDAAVAHATTITLAAADPTIIGTPAQAAIAAGQSETHLQLRALATGSTILTATANGSTMQVGIAVKKSTVLSIEEGATTLVVGATTQFFIQGGTTITCTVADPTVISQPGPISSDQEIDFTALAAGTTTITISDGVNTQTVPITVVDKAVLTLSSGQIGVGETQFRALDASALEPSGKMVTFTSSNPAVIAAPATVYFQSQQSVNFVITGLTTGTTIITATVDGVSESQAYYVGANSSPPSVLSDANVSAGCVEVGGAVSLFLGFTNSPGVATPVTLAASPAGIVSLASSATLATDTNSLEVPVSALAVGSVTLTATSGGLSTSASLSVVQNSPLAFNLGTTATAGFTAQGSVSSTCALANTVALTLMSSDATVLNPVSTSLVMAPNKYPANVTFETSALKAGSATISATVPSGYTAPTPVVVTVN